MSETAAPAGKQAQTYAAVKKIIDERGIKVSEAFAVLAAETGVNAGSIATAYYRTAKAVGDPTVDATKGRKAAKRNGNRPARHVVAGRVVVQRTAAAVPKPRSLSQRLRALADEIELHEKDAELGRETRRILGG